MKSSGFPTNGESKLAVVLSLDMLTVLEGGKEVSDDEPFYVAHSLPILYSCHIGQLFASI